MNPLLKIYFVLEGNYYKLMDFMQSHGLKVYNFFISPLEERRIPSFPVFVLAVLLVLIGLFFALSPAQSVPSNSFVIRVLSNGTPVGNASVSFIGASNSFLGRVLTNARGETVFTGTALSAVVSASGFNQTKIVLQPGLNIVSLSAVVIPIYNSSTPATYNNVSNSSAGFVGSSTATPLGTNSKINGNSTLVVSLQAVDGSSVDGFVTVYDNYTGQSVASGETSGGVISFILPVGETVYFSVQGFTLTSNNPFSLQSGVNNLLLTVSSFSSTSGSWLNVFNSSDNSSVSSFSVFVLNSANQVVFSGSGVNGSVFLNLSDGDYYAVVQAKGFVDGFSSFFTLPSNVSVSLNPISVSNTASLIVSVFNDQGNPVASGSISLWSGGLMLAPPQNFSGEAIFSSLPININVIVMASVIDETGSNSTFLVSGVNNASIFVFTNFGFVNVSAFDFFTGSPLNFNASSNFSNVLGNQTVYCSSSSSCLLKVEADFNGVVDVSSNGYFDAFMPFEVGVSNTTSVLAGLVNSSLGEGVRFTGIYPYDSGIVGSNSVSSLFFDTPYYACLNVDSKNGSSYSGFYFSTADGQIFNATSVNINGGGAGNCTGEKADFNSNNYSWIDARQGGVMSGLQCVAFSIPYSNNAFLNESFGYRMYSVSSINNTAFWFYYPFNQSIGFNQTDECTPPVLNYFANVSSPNDALGSVGNLSVDFSQSLLNGSSFSCGDGMQNSNCNDFKAFSDPDGFGTAGPLIVNFSVNANVLNNNYFLYLMSPGNNILSVNLTSTSAIAVPLTNVPAGWSGWDVSGGLDVGVITGYALLNLSTSSSSSYQNPVSESSLINVNFSNGTSSIEASFLINSTPLYPPNIFAGFDCTHVPFVNLTYNSNIPSQSGDRLSGWVSSCYNIPMMVSDVFPADAFKVYIGGDFAHPLLYDSQADPNPLSKCFELDDNNKKFYNDSFGNYTIIRFDPYYPNCPLTVVDGSLVWRSNSSVSGNVTFDFLFGSSIPSIGNCPAWAGGIGDCTFLNINVISMGTGEGLNLLPVVLNGYVYNLSSFYPLSVYPLNPQLWVLVDNNQLSGSDNNNKGLYLSFDSPISAPFSYSFSYPSVLPFGIENGSTPKIFVDGVSSRLLSYERAIFALSYPIMFDSWLDFYNPDFSTFNGVFSNLNSVISMFTNSVAFTLPLGQSGQSFTFNLPTPGGVVNYPGGFGVSNYLQKVNTTMYQTALWRGSSSVVWCEEAQSNGQCTALPSSNCKDLESDWLNLTGGVLNGWLNFTCPLTPAVVQGQGASDPGAPLKYFSTSQGSST
ncbi:MAG: hypothetical protein M1594_02445, partial [Candidatus Marsarchaeota archaeon]|nr:hypothetical protein [Candidatus Marsarchaeota archaeon]